MRSIRRAVIICLASPAIALIIFSALVAWSSLQSFCRLAGSGRCYPLGTIFARIYDAITIDHPKWNIVLYASLLVLLVLATAVLVVKCLYYYARKEGLPQPERNEFLYLFFASSILSYLFLVPLCINLFFWPFFNDIEPLIEREFRRFDVVMEEYRETHGRYPPTQHKSSGIDGLKKYRPVISYPGVSFPFDITGNCANKHWQEKNWAYREYMNGAGYCLEIPLPRTAPLSSDFCTSKAYILVICRGISDFQWQGDSTVAHKGDDWQVLQVGCKLKN